MEIGSFYFIKDQYFIDFPDDKLMTNKEIIKGIYDGKVLRYGECDTIHFGYVLGERKAFLIQNMCPVIDEYINNQYIDSATGKPVSISAKVSSEIERKAKKVLMLQRRGHRLIFPDVLNIEKQLQYKLKK